MLSKLGKGLSLSGVNENLLSREERTQYAALVKGGKASAEVRRARGLHPSVGSFLPAFLTFAFCLATTVGLFYAAINVGETHDFYGEVLGFTGLASIIAGFVFVMVVMAADEKRARSQLVSRFLKCIEFRERISRVDSPTRNADDNRRVYWATGNYDPERYYRETSGWSKEYRDYVRDAYGDLDTYEANKPD